MLSMTFLKSFSSWSSTGCYHIAGASCGLFKKAWSYKVLLVQLALQTNQTCLGESWVELAGDWASMSWLPLDIIVSASEPVYSWMQHPTRNIGKERIDYEIKT